MMVKLFVSPRIPGEPLLFLVAHHEGVFEPGGTLFTSVLPKDFAPQSYRFVDSLHDADYALFPHAVKSRHGPLIRHAARAREEAHAAGKLLIVYIGGDLSHNIFLDGVIVLKGSQYRHLLRSNEILAVPTAEDFAESFPIIPREKSDRPVVSFCGWAGFPSPQAYVKYALRNLALDVVASVLDPRLRAFKKGLYWRRRAIAVLAKDPRIETRFIIRKTFSASVKTISLDPRTARREYVENMRQSDFVLAPKGDGNFSVRFYEALSMGRIPILIDTDVVLPLESFIDYDSFILRVPAEDLAKLPDLVCALYERLTPEEFSARQQAARTAFTTYLRYDRFLDTVFECVVPKIAARLAAGADTEPSR